MVTLLLATAAGGGAGFLFHRFVGCRSGACAIWANPYISTIYGGMLGFLIGHG